MDQQLIFVLLISQISAPFEKSVLKYKRALLLAKETREKNFHITGMYSMKKYFVLFFTNTVIILLFFISLKEGSGLTKLINALFYVTTFYMIIFLYLLTVKGRFYDGIVFSCRNFKGKVFPKSQMFEGDQVKALPSEKINPILYKLFKRSFITLLFILLILQTFYFLF